MDPRLIQPKPSNARGCGSFWGDAMTDELDSTERLPQPDPSTLRPPIAQLWVMKKGGHLRAAALHPHDLGFELRIVDERGDFVFTQVTRSEADAVNLAAGQQDLYRAKGWDAVP